MTRPPVFALALTLAALTLACESSRRASTAAPARPDDRSAIAAVLDSLHDAASRADGPRYFSLFAPEAVFLGTDAAERWTIPEFRAYASARFATGRGWTYRTTQRDIVLSSDTFATFDELLQHDKYGTCRGSGALRRTGGEWRIVQYNLSIPIPNDLADDITARIQRDKATR